MRGHRYALSRSIDYRCLPGRPYRYIYSATDGDQGSHRAGAGGSASYSDYGTDQSPRGDANQGATKSYLCPEV